MPLTRDALWQRLTTKNPHWLTDGANLTPEGLRKLVEMAYDQGHAQGVANGRAMAEMQSNIKNIFRKAGIDI